MASRPTPNTPRVVAHRGLRTKYPENTTRSIQAAIEAGVWGVEFDVELTADLRPVVLHQETLQADPAQKRLLLAGRDEGRAWLTEWSEDRVLHLDAGSWFRPEFSHLRIPSLAEVLNLHWHDVVPCIELKDPFFWNKAASPQSDEQRAAIIGAAVEPFLQSLASRGTDCKLLSFSPAVLADLTSRGFSSGLVYTLWTDMQQHRGEALKRASALQAVALSVALPMLEQDPRWVDECHSAGFESWVYEVSPALGERHDNALDRSTVEWLAEIGVDVFISDHAEEAAEVLSDL